jgi:hypothetical protein
VLGDEVIDAENVVAMGEVLSAIGGHSQE